MKSCFVVKIQLHMLIFTKFQLLKELFKPHKFTCSWGHRSVFSLCTRSNNNTLFL